MEEKSVRETGSGLAFGRLVPQGWCTQLHPAHKCAQVWFLSWILNRSLNLQRKQGYLFLFILHSAF